LAVPTGGFVIVKDEYEDSVIEYEDNAIE
jgi:hypothetical protein